MHHMAITFYGHHVAQADRAELGNTPDIVSSKIHEHHMFGSFFRISEQFFGQCAIFRVGLTASARAS